MKIFEQRRIHGDEEPHTEPSDEEVECPYEKAAKEKVMARYLLQIEKPYWSDNIYMELDMTNLRMFYERALKEYEDIKLYFLVTDENEEVVLTEVPRGRKKKELRIQFEEKCFMTKLTWNEVTAFLEFQQKRIRDIEEVIDCHFDNVKKVILKTHSDKLYRAMKKDQEEQKRMQGGGARLNANTLRGKTDRASIQAKGGKKSATGHLSAQDQAARREVEVEEGIIKNTVKEKLLDDPDLQFENPYICTYKKKLEQLYEYEEKLLIVDKNKKENRRGLKAICRLQGSLTQSYFLWDAQQHKVARKLYYELEGREEEVVSDHQEEIDAVYSELAVKQQRDVARLEEEKEIDKGDRVASAKP